LAKRFYVAQTVFADHRFVVVTTDNTRDDVVAYVEKEEIRDAVVVIDDADYPDLGFEIEIEELYVYFVDQCAKLAFIIIPPYRFACWRFADHRNQLMKLSL